MTFSEYEALAARTDGSNNSLLNGVLGLAGEVGEVVELYKKHKFHGHELDIERLDKELGDILWYVAQCCRAIFLSMDGVAERNIEKLKKRYPEGFSSERSKNREELV